MAKCLPVAVILLLIIVFSGGPARAQQDPEAILRTLQFKAGSITLGDNLATIDQTENFRFLDNADTQTFLTKVWGNPPGAGDYALGMIVPVDANVLQVNGWAVVVSYDPTGYVSDDDAGKIDYDDLLADMKKATAATNERRIQQGYTAIELVGWAKKPYYDAAQKKLFWAKELRFGGQSNTLNYEIRILGRKGVLDLNVVASMEALPSIDSQVNTILSMVHFNPGNTYAEFDPKIDDAAAYGLAGLIAGGVLAKAGFFKGLIAVLLASKKLVAVALLGGFALAWRRLKVVFKRHSSSPST